VREEDIVLNNFLPRSFVGSKPSRSWPGSEALIHSLTVLSSTVRPQAPEDWCLVQAFARARQGGPLTAQGLLENLERMVEFCFVQSSLGDTAYSVQYGCVVPAAKELADFWQ